MTAAVVGTSSNLLGGTREFSNVTNTYAGHFISGGAAYNLVLPWQADKLELFNYTKWATNAQNLSSVWFRDMPAARALITNRGTTDLTSTLEATNGVTINNTAAAFADEHVTVTGISAATPAVLTAAAHGLSANDRVIITKLTGNIGLEMNNKEYVVQNPATNTFDLYDVYGNAITAAATYSGSGGEINKIFYRGGTVNSQPIYSLTLGTAVVGNDSDVMYFAASKYNAYYNLGDIG